MASIIRMLKPSKKHNNKENVPEVTFANGSLKTKKPTFNETIYAGEPQKIDLRLKSPYAVITKPKTTKGPMSCPGAPLEDRIFRNSSRKVKDDSVLNRRSELVDDQAIRNMMARQQYDMSMSQQDDSDQEKEELKEKYREKKSEVAMLKTKMQKMNARWKEEKNMMTDTIDDLSNENYQIRKSHDRLRHKYSELKQNIEVEKKMKCDVLKMLQEANARIEKLEKSRSIHDDSLNNSSLLIPTYNVADVTMEMSSEGAGEALCFPDHHQNNMHQSSMFMMTSIFGSSSSSKDFQNNPQSLEDDIDAQDEVRVFRNSIESIEEDEEMSEEEDAAEELELSSPFEVETARSSKKIKRAHSDSDLMKGGADTVSLAMEPVVAPKEKPVYESKKYSRTNSWLKRNSINPDDDASSDSSEEERLSIINRQLKKKGELVKYNPPRTKIHEKHFKRFGKNERNALAEFEYLQDMSTDVSGLQSSPELGQLMGQLQQHRI
uniref:PH domain-containing protein n=1 Tax=Caenorhabditis tropicalis TaxID=1561998 RepID=A0A1I7TBT0_9PELO